MASLQASQPVAWLAMLADVPHDQLNGVTEGAAQSEAQRVEYRTVQRQAQQCPASTSGTAGSPLASRTRKQQSTFLVTTCGTHLI